VVQVKKHKSKLETYKNQFLKAGIYMNKDMEFWDDIYDGWEESLEHEKNEMYSAFEFAKKAHEGQTRDEGTPYISHIVGVAKIYRDEFGINDYLDLTIIMLHDVIEDTKYNYDDIKGLFGKPYADWVNVLTKKEGQSVEDYVREIQESDFHSALRLIKLADRLHNLRSLLNTPENKDKITKQIEETKKYYLPMAKEVNMSKVYELLVVALNDLEVSK